MRGRIKADGQAALLACALLGAVMALCGGRLVLSVATLWAPALAAVLAVLVCVLCGRPAKAALPEWWPFLLLIALYMQIDPLTRLLHKGPLDDLLHRLDVALLGVSPTLWLERHTGPVRTEIMALGYSSYFVLPLTSAAPTYIPTEGGRMKHREAFREVLCAQVLALGLGFVLYVLVPARGPRFYLASAYARPLQGAWGYYEWAIGLWDRMQAVRCDAFPSLHTATAILALVFGLRLRRLFRPLPFVTTPLSLLLIASTIYLRMHHAVDVLAGLALGGAALLAADRLVGGIRGRGRGRGMASQP